MLMLAHRSALARFGVLGLFLLLALGLTPTFVAPRPVLAAAPPPPPSTVFVNLHEWKWGDISNECAYLADKGYTAVQVSPPNEHIKANLASYPHSWWVRYQHASYIISSRSGDSTAFNSMVTNCKNKGIVIYADVVINHMGDQTNQGHAGSTFNRSTKSYPAVPYGSTDFHSDCVIQSSDYSYSSDPNTNAQRAARVRNCQLGGLPDLDTGKEYVRTKIAEYLINLLDRGVGGFRIDAAKHMHPNDIQAILAKVRAARPTNNFYVVQEVIDTGGQSVSSSEYTFEDVNEFKYAFAVGNEFANGQLKYFKNPVQLGTGWGLLADDKAQVFIENHDTERGHGAGYTPVNNKQSADDVYTLANVFMLSWPYGYPMVMSSYEWANDNDGPPRNSDGTTKSVTCFDGQWICQHRWRAITNMVAFRNYATGAGAYNVTKWWDNGNDQIAFARSGSSGVAGFVVINREGSTINRSFDTGLPAGTYCNVIVSEFVRSTGVCSGQTITVASNGWATIVVPPMSAAAIHIGAKAGQPTNPVGKGVPVTFTVNGFVTQPGQEIYVVGSTPELGNWNTAYAVKLNWVDSDTWSGPVVMTNGVGKTVQFKFIVKQGSTVTWQPGSNRTYTVPATGSGTTTHNWN